MNNSHLGVGSILSRFSDDTSLFEKTHFFNEGDLTKKNFESRLTSISDKTLKEIEYINNINSIFIDYLNNQKLPTVSWIFPSISFPIKINNSFNEFLLRLFFGLFKGEFYDRNKKPDGSLKKLGNFSVQSSFFSNRLSVVFESENSDYKIKMTFQKSNDSLIYQIYELIFGIEKSNEKLYEYKISNRTNNPKNEESQWRPFLIEKTEKENVTYLRDIKNNTLDCILNNGIHLKGIDFTIDKGKNIFIGSVSNIRYILNEEGKVISGNRDFFDKIANTIIKDWDKKYFPTNDLMLHEEKFDFKSTSSRSFLNHLEICHFLFDEFSSSVQEGLKLRVANLPINDRSHYPNLFLTKKEQLSILIKYADKREEKLLSSIRHSIPNTSDKYFSYDDWRRLNKLVKKNKNSTINAIIEPLLFVGPFNLFCRRSLNSKSLKEVDHLIRNAKAKEFFRKQLNLEEKDIFIPRWYHATSAHRSGQTTFNGILTIIGSRHISSIPRNGGYDGTWISSRIEEGYGREGFAFNDHIETIAKNNPLPNIQTTHSDSRRWRGVMRPIPIDTKHYNMYIPFVKSDPTKANRKRAKEKCVKLMQEKGDRDLETNGDHANTGDDFKARAPMSFNQMKYMNELCINALGLPNLSRPWWSKKR